MKGQQHQAALRKCGFLCDSTSVTIATHRRRARKARQGETCDWPRLATTQHGNLIFFLEEEELSRLLISDMTAQCGLWTWMGLKKMIRGSRVWSQHRSIKDPAVRAAFCNSVLTRTQLSASLGKASDARGPGSWVAAGRGLHGFFDLSHIALNSHRLQFYTSTDPNCSTSTSICE